MNVCVSVRVEISPIDLIAQSQSEMEKFASCTKMLLLGVEKDANGV